MINLNFLLLFFFFIFHTNFTYLCGQKVNPDSLVLDNFDSNSDDSSVQSLIDRLLKFLESKGIKKNESKLNILPPKHEFAFSEILKLSQNLDILLDNNMSINDRINKFTENLNEYFPKNLTYFAWIANLFPKIKMSSIVFEEKETIVDCNFDKIKITSIKQLDNLSNEYDCLFLNGKAPISIPEEKMKIEPKSVLGKRYLASFFSSFIKDTSIGIYPSDNPNAKVCLFEMADKFIPGLAELSKSEALKMIDASSPESRNIIFNSDEPYLTFTFNLGDTKSIPLNTVPQMIFKMRCVGVTPEKEYILFGKLILADHMDESNGIAYFSMLSTNHKAFDYGSVCQLHGRKYSIKTVQPFQELQSLNNILKKILFTLSKQKENTKTV